MSVSENDFDDELLELIGASEKKRKRSQSGRSSATKRRKADVSDSDDGPESEEDDSNPYPLEDKYVDEYDRQRLLAMSEIEREEILAQRQEDLQKLKDKRNLDQMFKAQRGGDPDAVSKAAKRAHTQRGATREKTRKLDELKAKRKAKDEKKKSQHDSSKLERSASPMDMSSGEEEDGQISKYEQEEERDRRLLDKIEKTQPDEDPATLQDFASCRLTRDVLLRHYLSPLFEDLIKGAWVRYLDRSDRGQNIYRVCEITGLGPSSKPYKVENAMVDQNLELKYAKYINKVSWDKVSNGSFTEAEFLRLQRACADENVKLPSKVALERKHAQIVKLKDQPLTDNDITVMINRRNAILPKRPTAFSSTLEKVRLEQERTLALRRNDFAERDKIEAQLAALMSSIPTVTDVADDRAELLALVNERNRKANIDAVRQAEALEAERKRKERKLAAAGRVSTPVDPSARLKTVPRVFETSKSVTPNGTPKVTPQDDTPTRFMSPVPQLPAAINRSPSKKSFESNMVKQIEIDLVDF